VTVELSLRFGPKLRVSNLDQLLFRGWAIMDGRGEHVISLFQVL
jgi:hypothetical protein